MRIDVSTSIVIARPREQVAAYACNPDNAPEWYENVVAVDWQTPRPVRTGSRVQFRAHFMRRLLIYTYEFTDLVPDERLVMRTAEGPFPMETSYLFESVARGTRMTLRNRGEPGGFSRWLAPFLAMAIGRANRKDLRRLRAVLETAQTRKSASRSNP